MNYPLKMKTTTTTKNPSLHFTNRSKQKRFKKKNHPNFGVLNVAELFGINMNSQIKFDNVITTSTIRS